MVRSTYGAQGREQALPRDPMHRRAEVTYPI
jgi:hypothetical protein